jgi:hypothetical protein
LKKDIENSSHGEIAPLAIGAVACAYHGLMKAFPILLEA